MITQTSNREIAEYVLANNGATVQLLADGGQRFYDRRDGDVCAVGGARDAEGFQIPELVIPADSFDAESVAEAVRYVREAREGTNQRWSAIGFWIDEDYPNVVVVDAVDAIMGTVLAQNIAADRGEKAIFHIATGEVIATGI